MIKIGIIGVGYFGEKHLINLLELNKIFVLGHSMGGKTAMFLACKYPDKYCVAQAQP